MKEIEVAVVGAGVAGLMAARRLQERGADFVLFDEHARIGDSWRDRYDSLKLFSYRRYASLPGMRIPLDRRQCPSKDELADYLEAYARRFEFPVRPSTRVMRVGRDGVDGFLLELESPTGVDRVRASRVIIAAGAHRRPVRPPFADRLDPSILQVHSLDYRSMEALPAGAVLVVGAGNSGTDIALDASRSGRPVVLAGRHPGQVPFKLDSLAGFLGAHVFLFVLRHLTVRTPAGRAAWARQRGHGLMLIRNRLEDLAAAGVRRVGRVEGARDGLPVVDGGEVLHPKVIIWCTGSRPDLSLLDLDGALDEDGAPVHTEGISDTVPGLGFLGLDFQFSAASATIQGMDRDARAVVAALLGRDTGRPVDRAADEPRDARDLSGRAA